MDYELSNYSRQHLSSAPSLRTSNVYNFNNRTMLTDRPSYTVNPYHSLPLTSRYFMDTSANGIYIPHAMNKRTVSSNTPAEYADRFHSRPTGRPHVVGFDGRAVTSRSGRHDTRGFDGFFPSMKLRVSTPTGSKVKTECETPKSKSSRKQKRQKPPPFILELAPERSSSPKNQESPGTLQGTGVSRALSSRSTKTVVSHVASSPSSRSSLRTSRSAYDTHPPVYPYIIENAQVDDLSELPKPMMVISRDNPWVYRYKVKKSMNELSKILASKPPPMGASQSAFIH